MKNRALHCSTQAEAISRLGWQESGGRTVGKLRPQIVTKKSQSQISDAFNISTNFLMSSFCQVFKNFFEPLKLNRSNDRFMPSRLSSKTILQLLVEISLGQNPATSSQLESLNLGRKKHGKNSDTQRIGMPIQALYPSIGVNC